MSETEIFSMILGAILAFAASTAFWVPIHNDSEYHSVIIENGCGQYSPKSGKFEFLPKE